MILVDLIYPCSKCHETEVIEEHREPGDVVTVPVPAGWSWYDGKLTCRNCLGGQERMPIGFVT